MLGHLPNGNPVQRHSAGEHYPYVIAVVGRAGLYRYYELSGPGIAPYQFLTPGAAAIFAWVVRPQQPLLTGPVASATLRTVALATRRITDHPLF